MPRQLTIRNFDAELDRHLRALASAEGISLNQAALRLLQRGAGLGPSANRGNVVGSALDHLGGTWSEAEARSFEAAMAPFERIDDEFWGRKKRRSR